VTDLCVDLDESLGSIIARILPISFKRICPTKLIVLVYHPSVYKSSEHDLCFHSSRCKYLYKRTEVAEVCVCVWGGGGERDAYRVLEGGHWGGGGGGSTEALTVLEASFM